MNFYKNVIEHRGKLLVRGIHEGKEYKEKIDKGENPKKVIDSLGLERYCCRGVILSHVELIDMSGEFKKG